MAYFKYGSDLAIGETVYHSPNRPGIVISRTSHKLVKIKWLDGTVTEEDVAAGIKSYDALLADHQKKAQTHETNIAKLKKMAGV